MKYRMVPVGVAIGVFCAVSYLAYKFMGLNAANNSLLYILLFVGIYSIIKYKLIDSDLLIGNKLLWGLALVFSATFITGVYFDNDLPFETMTAQDRINYLLCIFLFSPLFKSIFTSIYIYLEKWSQGENSRIIKEQKAVITFLVAFAVIFICWIPVWLAYYPGLWNYDVERQIDEYYHTYGSPLTKHHPLLHTLLVVGCHSFGLQRDNYNTGVILYMIIQTTIMAGIFAYAYVYVCKHMAGKIFRVGVLVFFAVFPVNSMMVIASTKDVIFSGLVLLCLVLSLQVTECASKNRKNILSGGLMVTSVLMLLFRNNAIYAFVLFAIFTLALAAFRKINWKICIFIICCLLMYKISDAALTQGLNASDGSIREALSIPCLQFGRIYTNEADSTEDHTLISEIADKYYSVESPSFGYNPRLSDPIKRTLRGDVPVAEYIRDSIKLFFEYPIVSLDALIYLTEGSWNINDIGFASVYGSGLGIWAGYFVTWNVKTLGVEHESKFPGLELFFEHAFSNNEYQNWPVISILFAPAFYIWILVICTLGFIKTKNSMYLLFTGFLWCLFLTILAGPTIIIRYLYMFFICSPILLCMLNVSIRENDGRT